MSTPPSDLQLPFDWRSPASSSSAPSGAIPLPDRDQQTAQNDQRWLEGIIQDAALFSDWWLKTRIIQLAYQPPDPVTAAKHYVYQAGAIRLVQAAPSQVIPNGFPVYAGKDSLAAIATQAIQELLTHGKALELSEAACRQRYQYLLNALTQTGYSYIRRSLQSWADHRFTDAISRNFEVFVEAGASQPCVFLVVSTAPISLNTARLLPSSPSLNLPYRFRPLFNVDEMAEILVQQGIQTMTLRIHGYSNASKLFYSNFATEAQVMEATGVIHPDHAYVGYHWPSEQPFFSPGLTDDVVQNLGIFMKFMFSLLVVSFLFSVLLSLVLLVIPNLPWSFAGGLLGFFQTLFLPVLSLVFPLWFLAFTLLRLVVYQRDRYRAIHYGAPDLAEFFWRLDKQVKTLMGNRPGQAIAGSPPQKTVNLVGHSMGGLVVVNALRVLSDRYGKDEKHGDHQLGDCFSLGNLILASPDIPLELVREGRNNYVRSAMRRCRAIYLFSSDRDTVLRYLSTLGNWFSEPSLQMSGLRLGNVYLQRRSPTQSTSELSQVIIRSLLWTQDAIAPTSAYDLFERFNYLDCSRMKGTNGLNLNLTPITALVIDGINTLLMLVGRVDVHGGYFRTDTPAFTLLQLIIKTPDLSSEAIAQVVDEFGTQVRFLPARPYMTGKPDEGTG